ncbi:MAG: hypothetical protein FWG52_08580 [Proteobacteria bacterium]|nr:hypothetical protein [Pseudomonadota bacterium]
MKMSVKVAGFAALLVSLSFYMTSAQARNVTYFLPIQDVVEMGKAKAILGNDIELYFGNQPHPAIDMSLARDVVARSKARVEGDNFSAMTDMPPSIASQRTSTEYTVKNDEEACNRAMLAALVWFQKYARKVGGNAVVNIEGYYKKRTFSSDENFECHSGGKSGIFLKGEVVRLKR